MMILETCEGTAISLREKNVLFEIQPESSHICHDILSWKR